jgi:hypothetical protein
MRVTATTPAVIARRAAEAARALAMRMARLHGPLRARYFEALADAAEARADRLDAPARGAERADTTPGWSSADLEDMRRWVDGLRARLDAGALARMAPVDLGHGTARLPCEVTVRTLLANLDHLNQLPGTIDDRPTRMLILLGELARLRHRIG